MSKPMQTFWCLMVALLMWMVSSLAVKVAELKKQVTALSAQVTPEPGQAEQADDIGSAREAEISAEIP